MPANPFDARLHLALARVLRDVDQERSEQHSASAYMEAQLVGFKADAASEPPWPIAAEPELVEAWTSGLQIRLQAQDAERVEACCPGL